MGIRLAELSIKVGENFKASDILYPSFARPLFDISEDGKKAVKRWGFCSGAVLSSEGDHIVVRHEKRECVDYGAYLTGVWSVPERSSPPRGGVLSELVELMLESYRTFGVSTSPKDDYVVFTSIFLSRNTDYDKNTIRWVRELLYRLDDFSKIAELKGRDILKLVGSSYQLRQLPSALKCYSRVRSEVLEGRHQEMLKCSNVGPKVYHSYMLHVLLRKDIAPIDINLTRFLNMFSDWKLGLEKPEKRKCLKHQCEFCPTSHKCAESMLRRELGDLLGWFQNATYYHFKNYCKLSRCFKCPLNNICLKKKKD
ncbi:MAG: hypothetical protein QXE20_05755 [Acidilobaceae archaeon]